MSVLSLEEMDAVRRIALFASEIGGPHKMSVDGVMLNADQRVHAGSQIIEVCVELMSAVLGWKKGNPRQMAISMKRLLDRLERFVDLYLEGSLQVHGKSVITALLRIFVTPMNVGNVLALRKGSSYSLSAVEQIAIRRIALFVSEIGASNANFSEAGLGLAKRQQEMVCTRLIMDCVELMNLCMQWSYGASRDRIEDAMGRCVSSIYGSSIVYLSDAMKENWRSTQALLAKEFSGGLYPREPFTVSRSLGNDASA